MPDAAPSHPSARHLVAAALARAAEQFPFLEPAALDTTGLADREARLALAIHRTALQRWITIEHLLNQHLRQPLHKLEPRLQGVLLSAGAQLLFLDRLPVYAVVDESVTLTQRLVRKQAGGLVNAVLRRLVDIVAEKVAGQPWSPAVNRLPFEDGAILLTEPCLPDPVQQWEKHVAIATSHPPVLIRRWEEQYGREQTLTLALHGVQVPPLIVATEGEISRADVSAAADSAQNFFTPHASPGFIVWHAGHQELTQFLAGHPARRVQDPASAQPIQATVGLQPKLILDYCAGRGTKTRQLALLHPAAQILATDVDTVRLQVLAESLRGFANVQTVPLEELAAALGACRTDLLVLDVPCSNTAVLARRPEARYRYSQSNLDKLVHLQRQISKQALTFLAPGGHILYSTCSVEVAENGGQARWLSAQCGGRLLQETMLLPTGLGRSYQDGFYCALLQAGCAPVSSGNGRRRANEPASSHP